MILTTHLTAHVYDQGVMCGSRGSWVKDSNTCTYLSKDEKMANIYAIVRSVTVMQYQEDAALTLANRERKGDKYLHLVRKRSK